MKFLFDYYRSSIGKKWIVALTGLVLIAYVLGHLAGNLQIFISPEQINWYGARLHSLGPILWAIRAFLLACFLLHIATTIKLAAENRAARPERYAVKKDIRTTRSALTMVLSGLFLLAFVVIHLLQFTIRPAGLVQSYSLPNGENDVYTMVVRGFSNPLASGFYIVGMYFLFTHLSHGFSSFLQTLGLNTSKTFHFIKTGGIVLAWLVFAGYIAIPVSVMFGLLKAK